MLYLQQTEGLALVWASGQNIDRLVTLYKACRKAKRQLILDVYTSHILRATGNEKIPQADWQGIRIFLPASQKWRIIRDQSFDLVNPLKPYRIYPEKIALLQIRLLGVVGPRVPDRRRS